MSELLVADRMFMDLDEYLESRLKGFCYNCENLNTEKCSEKNVHPYAKSCWLIRFPLEVYKMVYRISR
jgi:hypothetical protein